MINWFNHLYPYSNLHELNLDWVIATVKNGEKEIADFVGVNTIKYANPILWNIESQYEANTVVVDGQTGNAYISVKAVPSGVHINRTEYWTQIYNYANVVDTLREQIAHNEGDTTTATHPFAIGDLVFIKTLLYRVIAPMIAGDSFVENSNIVKTTIEDELKANIQAIQSEASARQSADTQLQSNVDAEASARQSADTQLQSNIDAEASARQSADTQLQNNIDNAIDSLNNTITEGDNNLKDIIGNLEDLQTPDKTSIVNAVNDAFNALPHNIVNVRDFGATGDGNTNDYTAISNAIQHALNNNISIVYFPDGEYNCGNGQFTIDSSKITLMGSSSTTLVSYNLTGVIPFIDIVSPVSLLMYDYPRVPLINLCIKGSYFNDTLTSGVIGVRMGTDSTFIAPHTALYNVVIRNFGIGLQLSSAYKTSYFNCSLIANNIGVQIPSTGVQQAVPCNFYSCYFECNNVGIYGLSGGYNNLSFFGGAFEYNRSVHNCYTKLVFVGVRFEYDIKASCDASLNPRPVFQGSLLSGSSTVIKYIGCFFLGLNNFESNVKYWISNPYKASTYNISPFYIIGGKKISIAMIGCELADVNTPSGAYYIGTDKFYGAGNYTEGAISDVPIDGQYVVTGQYGFVTT